MAAGEFSRLWCGARTKKHPWNVPPAKVQIWNVCFLHSQSALQAPPNLPPVNLPAENSAEAETAPAVCRNLTFPKDHLMDSSILLLLGAIVLWFVLNKWILPRLGIQT